jgi:predicted branched-subunit amino acid permease
MSEASAPWRHPEYRRGAREMVGISLGIAAWGLVTGVAMIKSGMGLGLALMMSLMVFAGTAQLAAVPLIAAGAPIWVVWATALCLNLRFVIFSAQWRPYFKHLPRKQRALLSYFTADLNYVLFMRRFPEAKPAPEQLPYFWGGVSVNAGSWHVASLLGIFLGNHVPT